MNRVTNHRFPKHLSFFELDHHSENEAFYKGGNHRLEIRCLGEKTLISEYAGKELFKLTIDKDFQKAVFKHFYSFNGQNYSPWQKWRGLIHTNPYVQVEPFSMNGGGFLFFPAVFLFFIRIPVISSDTRLRLEKFMWYNGIYKKKWHSYQTSLFKKEACGWTKKDVWMIDLGVSQQEVFDICSQVTSYGNRESDCPIPIFVQEYNAGLKDQEKLFDKDGIQYKVLYESKQ
ncbi:MAG: hypothetical protein EOP48_05275 [Sphingobacteriales bacterium]|nr:MAG: hypothetical protein EOP48_05275 [Sphingobacteriales bacterium]